jgi:hypothetical protein
MILAQLQACTTLILSVPHYEHRVIGNIEQYKAIAHLVDGSRLHINEVWLQGVLHKYAYYWLTPTGALLQGWDNAPHHRHISTYPHHTHTPGQVEPSHVRTLAGVLNELERRVSGPSTT